MLPRRNSNISNTTSSSAQRRRAKTENQAKPKKENSSDSHRKPIYGAMYKKTIILPKDNKGDLFYCNICPGKPVLLRKNVDSHCFKSITHYNHVDNAHEAERT